MKLFAALFIVGGLVVVAFGCSQILTTEAEISKWALFVLGGAETVIIGGVMLFVQDLPGRLRTRLGRFLIVAGLALVALAGWQAKQLAENTELWWVVGLNGLGLMVLGTRLTGQRYPKAIAKT